MLSTSSALSRAGQQLLTGMSLRRFAYLDSAAGSGSASRRLLSHNTFIARQAKTGRNHYRPFTSDDEAQLTAVLTTKPRHVARHIRQSMLHSRRRITQFRNSVTYLMILLQSQLQKKQIPPKEATVLLESLMKECVELKQGDMAHLLFRASIRFRKYGIQVGFPMVRALYDSYKNDNAKELMISMADELQNDPPLRRVAVLAYQFGGQTDKALALLAKIPRDSLDLYDYCALIESFGSTGCFEHITDIVDEILSDEAAMVERDINIDIVLSTAIISIRGDEGRMNALIEIVKRRRTKLTDSAVAAILRSRLFARHLAHVEDIYATEREVREELQLKALGMAAETAIIGKCSEVLSRDHERGDDVMLQKVRHLRSATERAIDNDELDSLDSVYMIALIKGYGVLGHFDDMRACFDALRAAGVAKDHRLYDEMLKWYAYAHNVKDVIALKEEMTANNIYHTHFTYHNVFRVLDKYYPRMVEKYLTEMRSKGMDVEGFMYPTLLRVFYELGDMSTVESLYRDAKAKMTSTGTMAPAVVVQMLRCCQADVPRCEAIIRDAEQFGLLANEWVQAAIVNFYSVYDRFTELNAFLNRVPHKSQHIYRVLVLDAAKRKDRAAFQALLQEMESTHVQLTERLFSVVITGLSFFHDSEAVKAYVHRAMSTSAVQTPIFFADAASAFARIGETASVDQCWQDLLDARLPITMPVYNRFLDIYMSQNNIPKVQEILDTMMKLVPPNPVTATTVIDMLGKMGRLSEMEAVLSEMSSSTNAAPTLVTYHQAMNAYAKAGEVHKMEEMRDRLKRDGFKENAVTYNILFEGYGRAKRFEHLHELIEERKLKNVPMEEYGYVVLLNIYAKSKMFEETEALVDDMVSQGVSFSGRMLATVAASFCSVGNTALMEHYVALLLAHPECRQRDVESVYIMYARIRDVVKLQELLDTEKLPRSELIYNTCVGAFARAGEHTKVAHLLTEMEEKGFTLSRNASVTLSTLLLKAGKLELAQAVLKWKGMKAPEDSGEQAAAAATTALADEATADADAAVGTMCPDIASDVVDEPLQEQLKEEIMKVSSSFESELAEDTVSDQRY